MSTEAAEQSAPVESADVNAEQNTPAVTAAEGVVEQKQEESERKFSQAEVDAMIQKRLVKEARRQARSAQQEARERVLANEPKRDDFRDDDAYDAAKVRHLAEKEAQRIVAERDRESQQEKAMESFLEKSEKAQERYPDFQVVVGNPQLAINDNMVEFIADSEHGADVAYWLGKHPMKAAEIARLGPIKAARELSRIEAEIASKPKATPSNAPDRKSVV